MDPTAALMGILVAGASAAAKDVAGQAVKDLYAGLKAAVSRLVTRPESVDALDADPDSEDAQAEAETEIKASSAPTNEEVTQLAAQLAAALAELDDAQRERAGIDIGAVVAAKNAILRDFSAEGGIRIESVSAGDGDAVITGLNAGGTNSKK